MEVTHNETVCVLNFSHYTDNNRLAISLYEKETGEPYMVATVNMPNDKLNTYHQAFIKNYSENEGILEALDEANIIGIVKRDHPIPGVHLVNILKVG